MDIYCSIDKSFLQGKVMRRSRKFLTGGKVRKPQGRLRCNYVTDSKVWMKEEYIASDLLP